MLNTETGIKYTGVMESATAFGYTQGWMSRIIARGLHGGVWKFDDGSDS